MLEGVPCSLGSPNNRISRTNGCDRQYTEAGNQTHLNLPTLRQHTPYKGGGCSIAGKQQYKTARKMLAIPKTDSIASTPGPVLLLPWLGRSTVVPDTHGRARGRPLDL
ncbi:unnamed protein product [Ectocarpus fasciculatus]